MLPVLAIFSLAQFGFFGPFNWVNTIGDQLGKHGLASGPGFALVLHSIAINDGVGLDAHRSTSDASVVLLDRSIIDFAVKLSIARAPRTRDGWTQER